MGPSTLKMFSKHYFVFGGGKLGRHSQKKKKLFPSISKQEVLLCLLTEKRLEWCNFIPAD
jgi:hypothetical protein